MTDKTVACLYKIYLHFESGPGCSTCMHSQVAVYSTRGCVVSCRVASCRAMAKADSPSKFKCHRLTVFQLPKQSGHGLSLMFRQHSRTVVKGGKDN